MIKMIAKLVINITSFFLICLASLMLIQSFEYVFVTKKLIPCLLDTKQTKTLGPLQHWNVLANKTELSHMGFEPTTIKTFSTLSEVEVKRSIQ